MGSLGNRYLRRDVLLRAILPALPNVVQNPADIVRTERVAADEDIENGQIQAWYRSYIRRSRKASDRHVAEKEIELHRVASFEGSSHRGPRAAHVNALLDMKAGSSALTFDVFRSKSTLSLGCHSPCGL